jgi:hypothetical protein
MSPSRLRRWTVFAVAGLLAAATAGPASAQAWLPAKGEGTISVLFTNIVSRDHFLPDRRYDFGRIDANTLLADVTYGLTDRVAITFGVPVVVSRYRGGAPHRPVTLDDGGWHATTQDFRFNVRYNVLRGPLVVTPFVGTDLPSRAYEFYAHAAPGRRLKEVAAGASVAKLFAAQGLVLQGRYGLTFSEGAIDRARRFSVASIEAAYFLTPSVRVVAMSSARFGHTGIDLYPDSGRVLPFEIFAHHDQISRESFTNVGGGASYSISDRMDVFGAFTKTVRGRNTHAVNRGVSVGVSWTFGASADSALIAANHGRQTRSLVRCVCEKSRK